MQRIHDRATSMWLRHCRGWVRPRRCEYSGGAQGGRRCIQRAGIRGAEGQPRPNIGGCGVQQKGELKGRAQWQLGVGMWAMGCAARQRLLRHAMKLTKKKFGVGRGGVGWRRIRWSRATGTQAQRVGGGTVLAWPGDGASASGCLQNGMGAGGVGRPNCQPPDQGKSGARAVTTASARPGDKPLTRQRGTAQPAAPLTSPSGKSRGIGAQEKTVRT